MSKSNPLFGDWTGIPRGREGAEVVPTPVGVPCLACDEPIREGDLGEMMLHLVRAVGAPLTDDDAKSLPVHRECLLLPVIGHTFGICSCTNFDGRSIREAAIELERRVQLARLQATAGRGQA